MNDLIAKRYAKALMELVPQKELASQLEVLGQLSALFRQPETAELIGSPLVSNAQKFDLLVAPLKKKLDARL
jgi:F0F1-type ATP synthase delta subunit